MSDRNAKSDILPVSDDDILARVASLPISEWSYTTERGVRHVGPMAQDFYGTFNVGEDNRHITSMDEDGFALAAIKALNARLNSKLAQRATRASILLKSIYDAAGPRSRSRMQESDGKFGNAELTTEGARGRVGGGPTPWIGVQQLAFRKVVFASSNEAVWEAEPNRN